MSTKATENTDIGFRMGSESYAETAIIELRNLKTDEIYRTPNGSPVTITIYGRDSKRFKEIERAQQNRNIAKARRTRMASLTAEQLESNHLELIVGCIADWFGIGDTDGEMLECNEDNARALIKNHPDIRDQVEEAIYDRANFLGS